ncbi:MAG: DUF3052 domain-containing protein [Anaerolineae bacterium]
MIRKLGIKEAFKISVINPPPDYWRLLGQLPDQASVSDLPSDPSLDFVHIFVKDAAELERWLKELRKNIVLNGMIWISWPKRSSKVKTDLNENVVRDLGLKSGLVDTKVCAVDETWSGLKFVIRAKDRD